jgi:hypothetical protein
VGRAILTCAQCAAPHRPARGQTRFTCDWCGAENTATEATKVEELVVAGSCDPAVAVRRAQEELRRRGVRDALVRAHGPRWTSIWQVFSSEGDEFTAPGSARPSRFEGALRLPTAAYQSARDAVVPSYLPPRSEPERGVEEITAAARASFPESDAALHAIRLVWIPVCEVDVRVAGSRTRGLYVAGSGEILLEPLPLHATDAPLRASRLSVYAGFAGTALLLGAAIDTMAARTLVLGAWLGVGLGIWALARIPRGRRAT